MKPMRHPLLRFAGASLLALLPLIQAATPTAGSGDIAIYTNGGTAGPNISAGATITHGFDANNRQDAGTFSRSGSDITLLRSGHYMAIYNVQFDKAASANRSEIQSFLNLAGADLPIGWSQGYIRRASDADECVTAGVAIFEATANDVLQLRSTRTDTDVNAVTRAANETALQLIKLDDSTNMDFAKLSLATGVAGPNSTTFVPVPYDTTSSLSAGFSHGTPGQLTLVDGGKYLVTVNSYVTVAPGRTTRTTMTQRLLLDGSEVQGSKTVVYLRGSDAGVQSCGDGAAAIGMIIEADPGDVLEVEGRMSNSGATTYEGGKCALTVVRIPDTPQIRLFDGNNIDANPPTDTPRTFDSQIEVDASFSHAATTSPVTVNAADDYLFLGSFYDSVDAVARAVTHQGWSVNGGSRAQHGQSARYTRAGDDSAGKVREFGNTSGFIGDGLSATDTVEMVFRELGATGTQGVEAVSFQGLRLGPLFGAPAVAVNNTFGTTVSTSATITTADLLGTDIDTADTSLTYTVDTAPAGGTLRNNGVALGINDTFTQQDLIDGLITFDAGGSPNETGGFDFTLSDGSSSEAGTFVIRAVDAIVVAADSTSGTDEDTVLTEAALTAGSNLLDNDTGDALTVTSHDPISANGATITVNSDGTFTYDPNGSLTLQMLGSGDTVLNDTFDYTVTDSVGATATATVTVASVSGIEDGIGGAMDDIASGTATEETSVVVALDVTANDGLVNEDSGGNELILNYDASQSAGTGIWENLGNRNASNGYLVLTSVDLDPSPTTTRTSITQAYTWDDTADLARFDPAVGRGIHDIISGNPDEGDASWEYWVKPATGWDSSVMTIFETGGGSGFGIILDNGTLIAATELDGSSLTESAVTYDLLGDPQDLIAGAPGAAAVEADFQQFAVSIEDEGGLVLYVNGIKVDETFSGVSGDWDGGDDSGLGVFQGTNHGGFVNSASGGTYDAPFLGSMAIVRLYDGILTPAQVLQNYQTVATGLDVEGDAFVVDGIIDGTSALKTVGQTAVIASGATVTVNSLSPLNITYDPTTIPDIDGLQTGETLVDNVIYQIGSGGGPTAQAALLVTVEGINDAANDTLEATETLVTTFTANQIVGNDQHSLGVNDAFLDLNANKVTSADILAGVWPNTGTGGSTYDVNIAGGTLITPPSLESNFGAVGQSWQNVASTFTSFQAISNDDATFEIWFQPTPLTTGRQLLMESGGNGNGMSIVYNADTAEVDFIIDGGDDAANNIQVSATGIIPGEFNQLIAVYDKDSPTIEDTLTLYLNGDPTGFNPVANATDTNLAGTTNTFTGSDPSGIGLVNVTEALQLSFGLPGFPPSVSTPFIGQISIVRVYDRKLSNAEFETNFDAIVQPIDSFTGSAPTPGPASTVTTTLGATVTLNADGSFTYDSTGLADIPEGNVVVDTFDYTTTDGVGGTTTATVSVNVTGVGGFLAVDDTFGATESDGPTAFDPLANDSGAEASVIELQSDVSNLAANIPAGTTNGESADFLDGSGHGWQFLWNAPTGWPTPGFDGTTGALGSISDYQALVWDDTLQGWLTDADGIQDNATAEPGAYLRISPDGSGISGAGSTQDFGVGNTLDRCLILAYTVDSDGYYGITNSSITVVSGASGGITIETAVETTAIGSTPVAGGASGNFDQLLGFANANDTIYIAVCPNGSRFSDAFENFDFELVKLPSAESQLNDILGTVSTDGSTITYDPGTAFDGLAAGQTVDETITYTIRDLSSSLDYDGGTVAFTVGQTLTSSSGGSAEILSINGDATSGTLRLGVITGTIADNDTLSDGSGGAAVANGAPIASTSVSTAEFTVTVTGENDAPTAVDDPLAATTDEDTDITGALSVLLNDTDPDQGDALGLVVSEVQGLPGNVGAATSTDQGGTVTVYPDGTFDYSSGGLFNSLAVGESETDTFTYLIEDAGGLSSATTAIATITITGTNDPVTAVANTYALDSNATAGGNVITDDTGAGADSSIDTNDVLTISDIDLTGTKGFVSLAADGSFLYDPGCAFDGLAPGASDSDSFTYTLSDGLGETDTATVTFSVTGVNTPVDVIDPASLSQVIIGTGTQGLDDIAVSDIDSNRSQVSSTAIPLFRFRDGVTLFSDGRADADESFDLDSGPGGASLVDGDGMSIDISFVPQAGDLSGTVVVAEVGGSANGSSILLLDGIPHLASKAGSASTSFPTDDDLGDNVFRDLDWDGDSNIVVPLATTQVQAGASNEIAVVYDILADTVSYSVNGSATATATLLNRDGTDWNGDHTTHIGIAVSSVGAETSQAGSPFNATGIKDLAGGPAAVTCVSFWNDSTGSALPGLGESITATLTIQSWNGSDSLSGLTNQGGGVFDISGTSSTVNAALEAMEFVPGGVTTYPVTILVSIDDGDEDGGGAVTGAIYISDSAPGTVYVNDSFAGSFLDSIPDADNGSPAAPATLGFDAFTTITEGLTAVAPGGTVVINGGNYDAESLLLNGIDSLRLTDAAEAVSIGSLDALATDSIDIQNSDLTLGSDNSNTIIDCPITGTTGSLTKVGTGDIRMRNASTFTGTTTINEGRIVITYLDLFTQGSLASSGIIVNDPAILALGPAEGTTYTHTNPISGDGSVSSFEKGTVVFNTPGGNTFSGDFDLGQGSGSTFDGSTGAVNGFVVLNDSNDLGTGRILSRGGQLQAGVPGIVIPNDIDITAGGFRNGGSIDFAFSGTIATIDNSVRGFGNYGLEGLDLLITGNVDNSGGNVQFEGTNGEDNGTWTVTGNITGTNGVNVQAGFDNGVVTLSGNNTYVGPTNVNAGILEIDGTHTGGGLYTITAGAALAGSGSTDAAVTVDAGASLSPGADGIATLGTGDLDVAGTLEIDVDNTAGAAGTAFDQVIVTGSVTLSGALSVIDGPGVEVSPASIVVLDNDDVDAISGSFGSGTPFADYLGSGLSGNADLTAGDGNDLAIVTGTAIESWRILNGLALDGSEDDLDNDLDGLVNLLEFGFGTDAGTPDNATLNSDGSVNGTPTVQLTGGGGGVTFDAVFNRRDDAGQPGSVEYTVQFSGDLVTFYDSTAPVTIVTDSTADPAYHVASVPYPATLPDGKKARFFRVKVDPTP